jgi:DNA-binding MarR family transcriptional regulator
MPGKQTQRSPKRSGHDGVSTLEAHLGFWLRFVSNHVSGRFRQLVEENGVSVSEWVALRQLYPSQPVSPAELIESLGMTKGAISKILNRLEDKGLARRVAAPEDGRAQRIELTRAGRALVPRLAGLADQNDAHFFGHLSPEERETLQRTLMAFVRQHHLKAVPIE